MKYSAYTCPAIQELRAQLSAGCAQIYDLANVYFLLEHFRRTKKPEWWVKLGDFGLAKKQTDGTAYRTQAGTEMHIGPELYFYMPGLNTETYEYTNAVDIWALGCILCTEL